MFNLVVPLQMPNDVLPGSFKYHPSSGRSSLREIQKRKVCRMLITPYSSLYTLKAIGPLPAKR